MKDEKYEYVTNAFHELKSPLTTIMLAAEIIKTQNLDDKAKESYLIMILDESLRMKKLITKTINSLKNNYFDVNLNQCCDINEIIENVVKMVEDYFKVNIDKDSFSYNRFTSDYI